MKRLLWDRKDDSLCLRNNPEWCNIIIDRNNIMTIEYQDDFNKKTLTKKFTKATAAMDIARIAYDKLSCHMRGKKEDFNISLPGTWNIK